MKVDNARFAKMVVPGDQLTMDIFTDRAKAGIYKFRAEARVGEELACEAHLMCTMRKVS